MARSFVLVLLLACNGQGGGPDTDGDTGSYDGCASLFAATLADVNDIACDEPLPVPFNDCEDTPNACQAVFWDNPVSASPGDGHLELGWAPQCVDGTDGCSPHDPAAVVCVDGTRPYYYVEPGVTDDGSPSVNWFFRWHNGQTPASSVEEGCAFFDECGDGLGSQSPGGVPGSIASNGLFRPDPPGGQDWLREYNKVYFVDPCIADYYGGDRAYEPVTAAGASGRDYTFPYQFRGKNFLEGVFAQLASEGRPDSMPSLSDADLVVLYAWSGGGRHVIQNIDRLAWDADGDHAGDGGFLGTLAPDATVRGVVSSRFQPGLEVQQVFADADASASASDPNGSFTGMFADVAQADGQGSIYDVAVDHASTWTIPVPSHEGACSSGSEPPVYPPFGDAPDGCWSETPVYTNAAFRSDGTMGSMLDSWGYTVDASCLATHTGDPESCYDFQHVLTNHVVSDVFVYIAQHDQAYRSPKKLPTYAEENAYYWEPSQMRKRVVKQLGDMVRDRWTDSEFARGVDPSCGGDDCTNHGAAVFAPDLWLHDDPVNSTESGFGVHLCNGSTTANLSDALRAWAERTEEVADITMIEGVGGWTRCEDGSDADGDTLSGCQDPEWKYALKTGSDTLPACP